MSIPTRYASASVRPWSRPTYRECAYTTYTIGTIMVSHVDPRTLQRWMDHGSIEAWLSRGLLRRGRLLSHEVDGLGVRLGAGGLEDRQIGAQSPVTLFEQRTPGGIEGELDHRNLTG